jgi:hypothetical protein
LGTAEPGSTLVQPGDNQQPSEVVSKAEEIRIGSRLDQQGAEVAMKIHTDLSAMEQDIIEDLPVRRLFDSIAHEKGWPTLEDWGRLAGDVRFLKRSIEQIVTQARISRDEPWELYKLALSIKERWVSWRRDEAYRTWEKEPEERRGEFEDKLVQFGVPELEACWDRIIDGLRWLTSHTKATL